MSMTDMPVLILEFVGTVVVPATSGRFIAKDKFVANTIRNEKVLISAVGNNFTAWFLLGDGKIEEPLGEQTLRYHKLRKISVDALIIAELGSEAKAETTLSGVFSLMEKQKHGEDGVLLNNGWANIFYVKDRAGVLRAIDVRWDSDGWNVSAFSVDNPYWWDDDYQVFSRDSDLQSSEPSTQAA